MKTKSVLTVIFVFLANFMFAQFGMEKFEITIPKPVIVAGVANPYTDLLIAGQTYVVEIVPMTQKWVTSDQCLDFLRKKEAILSGVYGISLVYELAKDKLPKGRTIISFDEKKLLPVDSAGNYKVPYLITYSDGTYAFKTGNFDSPWYLDDCLLVICKKPAEIVETKKLQKEVSVVAPAPVYSGDVYIDIAPGFKLGEKDIDAIRIKLVSLIPNLKSIEAVKVTDGNTVKVILIPDKKKGNSIKIYSQDLSLSKGALAKYIECYSYLLKNGFTIESFSLSDGNFHNYGNIDNHVVYMNFITREFYRVVEQYQRLFSYGVIYIDSNNQIYDRQIFSGRKGSYIYFEDVTDLESTLRSEIPIVKVKTKKVKK